MLEQLWHKFVGQSEEPIKWTYLVLGTPLKAGGITLEPGTKLLVTDAASRKVGGLHTNWFECSMGTMYPTVMIGRSKKHRIVEETSAKPDIMLKVRQ